MRETDTERVLLLWRELNVLAETNTDAAEMVNAYRVLRQRVEDSRARSSDARLWPQSLTDYGVEKSIEEMYPRRDELVLTWAMLLEEKARREPPYELRPLSPLAGALVERCRAATQPTDHVCAACGAEWQSPMPRRERCLRCERALKLQDDDARPPR